MTGQFDNNDSDIVLNDTEAGVGLNSNEGGIGLNNNEAGAAFVNSEEIGGNIFDNEVKEVRLNKETVEEINFGSNSDDYSNQNNVGSNFNNYNNQNNFGSNENMDYNNGGSNNQSYQDYMSYQDSELKKKIEKEKAKFDKKKLKEAKKQEKKLERKGKKKGTFGKVVGFVACAMAFGIIALGTMYLTGDALGIIDDDNKSDRNVELSYTEVSNNNTSSTLADKEEEKQDDKEDKNTDKNENKPIAQVMDVSGVVENVMPSVVSITSKQKVQSGMNFWYEYYFNDGGEYEEETGAGSGIIIGQNDSELLIVTNNHVVEGADSLQVQFIDEETVDAYIKGTDSEQDLAIVVVKLDDIKDKTMGNIKIATMGNSDELKVGEGTIAIGNALGYGQSVTVGVVSALNKEVVIEDKTMELIQTDAAINPGNSGGALLNTDGELIGINVAKYSSSTVEGMGFAIPVTSVSEIIDGLMNMETLTKVDPKNQGYLNIYGRDVTEELSEIYNAPSGVLVVDVIEDGAAEKAGIQKGDIITKIEGVKVSSMEDLSERLQYYAKGKEVIFTIEYLKDREYVEKEVKVVLGENKE